MKNSMKRLTSLLLVLAMVLSVMPMAFAGTSYQDFPTGWSAVAMQAAVDNGLMSGFTDGTIRPEMNITRAEVATMMVRAFGAETTADISAFADVPSGSWFYSYIAKAVKMGALNGTSTNTMEPDRAITREEVFTILARILVLSDEDTAHLSRFNDASDISVWAVPYLSAMAKRGYINGDPTGKLNPQAYITREEFAQVMYNAIRTYITKAGTYSLNYDGITVVRTSGVKLVGASTTGDLVIGDGAGTGEIILNNVTIEKRLLARGGTITVSNSKSGEAVVVNNVNGITQFMNYRTDAFFKGIIEKTAANFLSYSPSFGGGGSSGGNSTQQYTLTFELNGNVYKTISNITHLSSLGAKYPTPAASEIVGYRFLGWYDGTTEITASTPITKNMTLVAKLQRIDYPVKYQNEDGSSFSYFEGYTPVSFVNIDTVGSYVLPTAANIKRTGYQFVGWKDASGNAVTSLNITAYTPTTGFVLIPEFTLNTYYVEFYYQDGTPVTFVPSYTAPTEYSVVSRPALPTAADIQMPSDQQFVTWVDQSGTPVSVLNVTDSMANGAVLKLYTSSDPICLVSFYNGYGSSSQLQSSVVVRKDEKVSASDIPVITSSISGYSKNETVASVYAGNSYTHQTAPSYWYECYTYVCDTCGEKHESAHQPTVCKNCGATSSHLIASGKAELVPFDENVVVSGHLNVYLLYQRFGLYLSYTNSGLALAVTAAYDEDTRLMDTVKDLAVSTGNQLNLALQLNQIPKYDEVTTALKDRLVTAGLIDANNNIQVLYLPISISSLVNEETANNMVKQYIRDVVNDPSRLDSLLNMVDISTLIQQMDTTTLVNSFTDQELLDLIQSSQNRDKIVNAVVADLQKGDSSSILPLMTDSLIEDLKNGTPSSAVLQYIRNSDQLIDMIITSLSNNDPGMMEVMTGYFKNHLTSNPTLVNALTAEVQSRLQDNTIDGAQFRESLLTNTSLLSSLLGYDEVKNQVINLLLDASFIEKALSNDDATFYNALLNQAVANSDFMDYLADTDQFGTFVLQEIRKGSNLTNTVKSLIHQAGGTFASELLDKLKTDTSFLALLQKADPISGTPEGALRAEVLNAIAFSDYVTDQEDLLRYIFGQSGVVNSSLYSSFISTSELEDFFSREDSQYATMTAEQKQNLKNSLYTDTAVRDRAITKVLSLFDDYKVDLLDDLVNQNTITDTRIEGLINDLLVDYLERYIDKDVTLSSGTETVIEQILLTYIREIMKRTSISDAQLSSFKNDIVALKNSFVNASENKTKLITVIKNFVTAEPTDARKLIDSAYTSLISDLAALIAGNASVRADVSAELMNITFTSANLVTFVTGHSDSDVVKDLLSKYFESAANDSVKRSEIAGYIRQALPTLTDAELIGHIQTFMQNPANETTIRNQLKTYLTQMSDSELRSNINVFLNDIDLTYIQVHRSSIISVLNTVDLSGIVDAAMVKSYVNGLTKAEKDAFATKVFNSLKTSSDYRTFMQSLMHDDTFVITSGNAGMIQAVSNAIRNLDYDMAMNLSSNAMLQKIIDIMGDAFLRNYFNTMKNEYCDGLDAAIARVNSGSVREEYTTSLTLRLNIMEVLQKLYDKTKPEVISRLQSAGVRYDENPYLKYLVEHDIMAALFNGSAANASGDFTGYQLKDEMDYYNYLVSLLIVADDALCWYGERSNVTQSEFEAVYDALFARIYTVHSKVNNILDDYVNHNRLPSQVQAVVNQVQQINSLLTRFDSQLKSVISRYLNSSVNSSLSGGTVHGNAKVKRVVDLLVGAEDPIFSIDGLYAVFYEYDDTVQAKLKELIDSGKLKTALDKFETTNFGSIFKGNGKFGTVADKLEEIQNSGKVSSAFDSIYDLLVVISKKGIEPFRVEKDDVTVTDAYQVNVAGVVLKIKRFYR